jgi:iron(III) transport system substrate-binding protein
MSPLVRMIGRILLGIAALCASPASAATVVVYVSEDQVFSEPVLKDFERETGIEVKAVYDTEETKSTGVMNRLIAEKNNPQADVYWANEPIRAEVLKQRGIAEPYFSPNAKEISAAFKDPDGNWTGFSARARVLIVHKRLTDKPHSILAYTDPRWKGRAVIANPLFGTTTAHVAALFLAWGEERARKFMNDLQENATKISTSPHETAVGAVEDEEMPVLVEVRESFRRFLIEEDVLVDTVVVPHIVRCPLIVPPE